MRRGHSWWWVVGDGGGGGWGGVGGGEDSFSLVFENSIVLIKCTLYDTVFQRQVSICRGVVFSYSFSIYCAAYHGIWCSAHNVNTTLYNVDWRFFSQRCKKDIPATLLQRKVQRYIPKCPQCCKITLYLRCIHNVICTTLQQHCGRSIYTTCRWHQW